MHWTGLESIQAHKWRNACIGTVGNAYMFKNSMIAAQLHDIKLSMDHMLALNSPIQSHIIMSFSLFYAQKYQFMKTSRVDLIRIWS